jgi:hypothetical protein
VHKKKIVEVPEEQLDGEANHQAYEESSNNEWEELFDEASGHSYYHHRLSGETSWELPDCGESERRSDAVAGVQKLRESIEEETEEE